MAMPRKPLNSRSKAWNIRLGLHLRALLAEREMTAVAFRDGCKSKGLDVSIVTIHKWMRGERLPRSNDFEAIGAALGLSDYRKSLPPPRE